jgi:hypothetical protein
VENLSPLNRWRLRLCAAVGISAISVLGTLLLVALRPVTRPIAPLTTGLQGTWKEIRDEFDSRLTKRFPLGSSAKAMAAELKSEGFVRQDWESSIDLEHEASRDESNFLCNKAALIFWREDTQGRLTAIRGEYPRGVCL